ncbi:MAG: DNA-3-methyladenine glycosylase [Bacteroidota bacterium]
MKLEESFYQRKDVVKIAKELLGKVLITNINQNITGGIIVETEAYSFKEKGCHAYNNRMTERNKVMFEDGGRAYVYLCYGIHHLFNVVTNVEGKADAVLIRALEPILGETYMLKRMKTQSIKRVTSGPGKLTKALGIDRRLNGHYLLHGRVWIEDYGITFPKNSIRASSRIGIAYAEEDADLPWRFTVKGSEWISKMVIGNRAI